MEYDTPDKSGSTKRQHLLSFRQQLEKAGKSKADLDSQFADLEPPPISAGVGYLLNMFSNLSCARQYGMSGPMPISYQEILAYNELLDVGLEPWEVEAIRLMDQVFVQEAYSVMNKDTPA